MALFNEDDRPKPKLLHTLGEDIEACSIEEIDRRVALLQDEILRLEREKAKKTSLRGAADAFFKS